MKILFLDDELDPSNVKTVLFPKDAEFVIFRTYKEFMGHLYELPKDELQKANMSFDYYLSDADYPRTGMWALEQFMYMCDEKDCSPEGRITFHSRNEDKAREMRNFFRKQRDVLRNARVKQGD